MLFAHAIPMEPEYDPLAREFHDDSKLHEQMLQPFVRRATNLLSQML